MNTGVLDKLRGFLRELGNRYGRQNGGNTAQVTSLALASATLRDLESLQQTPDRPVQIGVLGPTQAGKSTVVNLLLGSKAAKVSPLAGYTVRPEGFGVQLANEDDAWLHELLPGEPGSADTWHFERLDDGAFANTIIWDTPDFDSLAAHSYQHGVLNVAAMADVVLLVVSKEKYADLSVWNTLKLIAPLDRPLLVCLNKITPDAQAAVEQSLRERLADYPEAQISILPQHPGLDDMKVNEQPGEVAALRSKLEAALTEGHRNQRTNGLYRLLQEHWPSWVSPLEAEHLLDDDWQGMVGSGSEQALNTYQQDYLEHADRYETFRRAIAQLLTLLELPGLAGPMGTLRSALTWPARKLTAAYRRQQSGFKQEPDMDGESAALVAVLEQMLRGLQRDLLQRSESGNRPVFNALGQRLAEQHDELTREFRDAVRRYHEDFQPEIDRTANELYENLQQKPAALNSLRAVRGLTDATGIAFAIKTGGVGVSDLLFAPAMLSLTSTLTEGALGSYMTRVADELKSRQLTAVKEQILEQVVTPRLLALMRDLQGPEIFGIDRQQLQTAESAMEALCDE